jgi:hypothetical protein
MQAQDRFRDVCLLGHQRMLLLLLLMMMMNTFGSETRSAVNHVISANG